MSAMENFRRPIDLTALQKILDDPLCGQKCSALHAGDCNSKAFIQFLVGFPVHFKMYSIVHLTPFLLFRRAKFRKNPRQELIKFFKGFIKSLLFACLTSAVGQRSVCLLMKFLKNDFTIAHYPTSIAGVCLLLESPTRQAQIAIYCVSKAWETAYKMMKRRSLPVAIPMGNLWINAVSLAIIAFIYMSDPQVLRGGYRNIIELILKHV